MPLCKIIFQVNDKGVRLLIYFFVVLVLVFHMRNICLIRLFFLFGVRASLYLFNELIFQKFNFEFYLLVKIKRMHPL